MASHIARRKFLATLGGAAAMWPLAARAQQAGMPVVGLVNGGSARDAARQTAAFRKGLNETGYLEGQNVTVEYHWLDGQYDRLPSLMADLVRRRTTWCPRPFGLPCWSIRPMPRLPRPRFETYRRAMGFLRPTPFGSMSMPR